MRAPLLAVVGLLATSLASTAAAPAEPTDDWLIAEVVVAGEAVDLEWEVDLVLRGTKDSEPRLIAMGSATGDEAFRLSAREFMDGDTRLTTVTPLGNEELVLTRTPNHDGTASAGWSTSGFPGGRHLFVVIATGMDFAEVTASTPKVSAGELVSFTLHRGGGSRAIRNVDLEASGVGVSGPGQAVGAVTHEREMATGIIGGQTLFECGNCATTWASPDGRSGSRTTTQVLTSADGSGDFEFAGPAGTWEFSWTGGPGTNPYDLVDGNDGVFAVYAPVGDLHRWFDGIVEGA